MRKSTVIILKEPKPNGHCRDTPGSKETTAKLKARVRNADIQCFKGQDWRF